MDPTSLDRLRSDAALRSRTDTRISPFWVFVPMAGTATLIATMILIVRSILNFFQYVASLHPGQLPSSQPEASLPFSDFFAVLLYVQIIQFFVGCALGYVVYLLVRRRNAHFVRAQRLKVDLVATLRDVGRTRGVDAEANLALADGVIREADGGDKSAILWALLVLLIGIPYVGLVGFICLLYSFSFLGGDWKRHEEREDRFFAQVELACTQLGIPFTFTRFKGMPNRSAALYIVGTIFTAGFFEIIWLGRLITDPNPHLKNHVVLENGLMSSLDSAFATPPSST